MEFLASHLLGTALGIGSSMVFSVLGKVSEPVIPTTKFHTTVTIQLPPETTTTTQLTTSTLVHPVTNIIRELATTTETTTATLTQTITKYLDTPPRGGFVEQLTYIPYTIVSSVNSIWTRHPWAVTFGLLFAVFVCIGWCFETPEDRRWHEEQCNRYFVPLGGRPFGPSAVASAADKAQPSQQAEDGNIAGDAPGEANAEPQPDQAGAVERQFQDHGLQADVVAPEAEDYKAGSPAPSEAGPDAQEDREHAEEDREHAEEGREHATQHEYLEFVYEDESDYLFEEGPMEQIHPPPETEDEDAEADEHRLEEDEAAAATTAEGDEAQADELVLCSDDEEFQAPSDYDEEDVNVGQDGVFRQTFASRNEAEASATHEQVSKELAAEEAAPTKESEPAPLPGGTKSDSLSSGDPPPPPAADDENKKSPFTAKAAPHAEAQQSFQVPEDDISDSELSSIDDEDIKLLEKELYGDDKSDSDSLFSGDPPPLPTAAAEAEEDDDDIPLVDRAVARAKARQSFQVTVEDTSESEV